MRLDSDALLKALDWLYNKAINGIPGSKTVEELAKGYLEGNASLHSKEDSLIRWQIAKATTSAAVLALIDKLIK